MNDDKTELEHVNNWLKYLLIRLQLVKIAFPFLKMLKIWEL